MASNTSFFVDIGKLTLRRFAELIWLTILWSAALFLILPMPKIIRFCSLLFGKTNIHNGIQIFSQYDYLMTGVLMIGIIAACVVQAFMNSKTRSEQWLSLSISREKLFTVNLIAGGMAVLIPLTATYILTTVLTVLTPTTPINVFDIGQVLSGYLRAVGLFLISYAITTFWCVLSRRTTIAVFCTLFTPTIVSIFVGIFTLICRLEYKTFYASRAIETAMVSAYPFATYFIYPIYNPIYLIMDIVWAIIAVGLLVLSAYLFKKRRPETNENKYAYLIVLPLVKYAFVLIAAALGWLLFKGFTGNNLWGGIGAVILGLGAFLIINAIKNFVFDNLPNRWWKFLMTMGLFGLCICAVIFDPFSFDTRLPAREQVTQARVYELELNGVNLYLGDTGQNITDPEAINSLYNLSAYIAQHKDQLQYNHGFMLYNDHSQLNGHNDVLIYSVNYNGFSRSYTLKIDGEDEEIYNIIFNNPKTIMETSGAYTFEPDEIQLFSLECINESLTYTVTNTVASGPENSGLISDVISALRADVLTTSASKLKEAQLLCTIQIKGENGKEVVVPVFNFYQSIRDTWLWPVIWNHMLKTNPIYIQSIKIEEQYGDFSQTITDPEQIAEIAPILLRAYDMYYNPFVSFMNSVWIKVTVIYNNGSTRHVDYISAERMPEWLTNLLELAKNS